MEAAARLSNKRAGAFAARAIRVGAAHGRRAVAALKEPRASLGDDHGVLVVALKATPLLDTLQDERRHL